jgi:hypothetical protein
MSGRFRPNYAAFAESEKIKDTEINVLKIVALLIKKYVM